MVRVPSTRCRLLEEGLASSVHPECESFWSLQEQHQSSRNSSSTQSVLAERTCQCASGLAECPSQALPTNTCSSTSMGTRCSPGQRLRAVLDLLPPCRLQSSIASAGHEGLNSSSCEKILQIKLSLVLARNTQRDYRAHPDCPPGTVPRLWWEILSSTYLVLHKQSVQKTQESTKEPQIF